MKSYIRYFAMLLVFCLFLERSALTAYASDQSFAKETGMQVASMDSDSVTNMYNLVVFVRFQGDDEFINDTIANAGNITQSKLVDNTYNHSTFSLREYYQAVSNHSLNINTVYLSASESDLSSFVLDKSRGYYSPQSAQNPEGYTTQSVLRRTELVNDWSDKVQKAFDQGIKPKTLDGNEIDYAKLDSNGDKVIDSITVLYPPDSRYSAEHGGPLWAYQWYTGGLTVNSSAGTLRSNNYFQTSLQNDTRAIYLDTDGKTYFANAGTAIHEMGHVFGLKDLYSYNGTTTPVHYMSSMAKFLSPVVQFMTAREREAVGWIAADQVKAIEQPGTYTLQPMMDDKQTGIMTYTLPLSGNKKLYLEYRYVEDSDVNRFDFNPTKRDLYNAEGNRVNVLGLNKSGLLVCEVDMNSRFPDNSYGTPQLQVIGLDTSTKVDAPRTVGEVIEYGGYTIKVDSLSKEQIQFTVTGNGFENSTNPVVNDVKIVSPMEVSGYGVYTMSRGSTGHFVAKVIGSNLTADEQGITWSVMNNTSADTKIDPNTGLLYISPEEPVGKLITVVAYSTFDSNKYGAIFVEIQRGSVTNSITYAPGTYGTGAYVVDKKTSGQHSTLKNAIFTREGSTQIGWSLTDGGSKSFDFGQVYNEDKSLYLYPAWSQDSTPTMPPEEDTSGDEENSGGTGDSDGGAGGSTGDFGGWTGGFVGGVSGGTGVGAEGPGDTPGNPSGESDIRVPVSDGKDTVHIPITVQDKTVDHFSHYVIEELAKDTLASITTATNFRRLKARSVTQTKNSIQLKWAKIPEADGYIIYGCKGNSNGKKYTMKKIKTLTSNSSLEWTQKHLEKGTYYKYKVKAYKLVDGNKKIIATSVDVYASTQGGKYGVAKKVLVSKVGSQKVTSQKNIKCNLKLGKTMKLVASEEKNTLPVKKYRALSYESSNEKIAKVDKYGKITSVAKGTCKILVYAQNGVYRIITVTVK